MANFDDPWLVEQRGDCLYIKFRPDAISSLGEIEFLDLPNVGANLKKGMPSIGIEAVNWIGTSKVPVDGTVIAVNNKITDFKSHHVTSNDWLLRLTIMN